MEQYFVDEAQDFPRAYLDGPIAPAGVGWGGPARRTIQHHTVPTLSQEDFMTSPAPVLPQFPGGVFSEFVNAMNRDIARSHRTPEEEFQALEVRPGDRVRLTPGRRTITSYASPRWVVDKDASVLEGTVLAIKVKGGKSQLRITGFDHTGPSRAGGQHVWFPVEDYRVEVLHKVYRITDEDRLIAAVANVSEERWCHFTDDQRASYRRGYGDRAARIKQLLQAT